MVFFLVLILTDTTKESKLYLPSLLHMVLKVEFLNMHLLIERKKTWGELYSFMLSEV